jgi:hypothetical protein
VGDPEESCEAAGELLMFRGALPRGFAS